MLSVILGRRVICRAYEVIFIGCSNLIQRIPAAGLEGHNEMLRLRPWQTANHEVLTSSSSGGDSVDCVFR